MRASLRRTGLAALVVPAAAGLLAAAPLPGDAGRVPQLSADPAAVAPGDALTLHGSGFPRHVHVALMAGPRGGDPIRMGGANTGQRGSFVATIHIRPGARAGAFVALACHDHCQVQASARFRIVTP